uniref:Uncharacterized protein n=1 Tax=Ixodes scapularis TaxID=6945 RepID=A0A4D5S0H5_IXOSC
MTLVTLLSSLVGRTQRHQLPATDWTSCSCVTSAEQALFVTNVDAQTGQQTSNEVRLRDPTKGPFQRWCPGQIFVVLRN